MLFVVNDGVFIYKGIDDIGFLDSVGAVMLGPGSKGTREG